MDFLKSAVASAISKGPPFPYTFGDRVDVDNSIWTLYNGSKREDGSSCSIFSFDVAANKSRLPLAKNAVRKLRTLRHPGVIKILDSVETETYIYIATERLTPLRWHVRRKSMSTEMIKWGLYSAASTLKFINDEASSVHGNFRLSSLFTSESGEWKVGGLEVLSSMKDDAAIIYTYSSLLPDSGRYAPSEVAKSGWEIIKRQPISAVDAYYLGTLIFEVFNGEFISSDQVGQTKNIPPSMQQSYKRLVNGNPKARSSVGAFLEQGRRSGGFFATSLIQLTEGIESLGLKSEGEREEFLSELNEAFEDFPEEFLNIKVLPELLKSVEFGGGGPKVFSVVMKIGAKIPDEDYDTRIIPIVNRLFSSQDRVIRVCLLDNLPLMIDHLPQKLVNDKIFPQMVTGFIDVAPVVREQTVKAVLTIITKLSDRTINGELLKYLAKTSNDEQPGIRTNTTICLGKIAKYLSTNTRQKVLAAAFARSLRDPFVHARNAALLALGATSDVFTDDDCANKILPALCPSLVDKEKIVRDQANKTLDLYLNRIRKYSLTLPDTAIPQPNSSEAAGAAAPRMETPQNDTSWAGWAISSFTNKISTASGQMQNGSHGVDAKPKDDRSSSVPPSADTARPATSTGSASALHRKALATIPLPSSTPSADASASSYFEDNNAEDESVDAWAEMGEDSFFDAPTNTEPQSAKPANKFDDRGEPDFAGWLAAQSQTKSKAPLPKGLSKASAATNGRPAAAGRSTTTGSVGSGAGAKKLAIGPAKPMVTAPKKIDTKPKEAADVDDGWGDGW
ncbi:MAG: hypothetical protein M1827_005375 [Pycnora praestabilis]|nr:MAG: hypothetical protein M1827_005375 [Pycnora praestabilis]